jgi:hypothetical protein
MATAVGEKFITNERRKYNRANRLKMMAKLNGQTYLTEDWSMGGFLVENYEGRLATGALITVECLGHSKTKLHTVDLPARVVRLNENTLAVSYLSLNAKAYEFLQQSMTDSGDMRSLI